MLEQKNHSISEYDLIKELYEKIKPILLKNDGYTFTEAETQMLNQLFYFFENSPFFPSKIIVDVLTHENLKKELATRVLLAKGVDRKSFTKILKDVDFGKISKPVGFFQRLVFTKNSQFPQSNMRYIFDKAREFANEVEFINMLHTIIDRHDHVNLETFKHIFRNEDKTFAMGVRILFNKKKGYQGLISKIKSHEIYSQYV